MPIRIKNTKPIIESLVEAISKETSTDKANIHAFCTHYGDESVYGPAVVVNITWSCSPNRSPDVKKNIIRKATDAIADYTETDKVNIVFLFHDLTCHDVGINEIQRTF